MQFCAWIIGDSPVELWGLDTRTRLRRQLESVGEVTLVEGAEQVPSGCSLLVLRADHLLEVRTLAGLLEHPDVLLRCPSSGAWAAAHVRRAEPETVVRRLREEGANAEEVPSGLRVLRPDDLGSYDSQLRKAQAPMCEPITAGNRDALEARLYGGAYKGITDLVTKWVWPAPARRAVRLCATHGVTPNMVTTLGFLLVLLASWAFLEGAYWLGLAAGWLMTYLDTVDGKLARVTVKSSRFGHYFDHGIDLIHPPFWYVFWGMGLAQFEPVLGLGRGDLYWAIGVGYVVGRLAEGLFHVLGDCSIFTWRPFDSYFRLVTARRNPCLIILTVALALGHPDWGLIGVAFWTVATSAVLVLRLLQGTVRRLISGPLVSWLAEAGDGRHARAYRTFATTRSAYRES